jgi:hypothetical protein
VRTTLAAANPDYLKQFTPPLNIGAAAQRGRNLRLRMEGDYARTFVLFSGSTLDANGKQTAIGELFDREGRQQCQ